MSDWKRIMRIDDRFDQNRLYASVEAEVLRSMGVTQLEDAPEHVRLALHVCELRCRDARRALEHVGEVMRVQLTPGEVFNGPEPRDPDDDG